MKYWLLLFFLSFGSVLRAEVSLDLSHCPKVGFDIFVLVDTSDSMGRSWGALANSLEAFADQRGPLDNIVVMGFADAQLRQIAGRTSGDRMGDVGDLLRQLSPGQGNTDILGALTNAVSRVSSWSEGLVGNTYRIPLLLVLTDGQDFNPEWGGILGRTGTRAGEEMTPEGMVNLFSPSKATWDQWAALFGQKLKPGDYQFVMAIFNNPVGVETYTEMARRNPSLGLQVIQLERGFSLPIGVLCVAPKNLDFGSIFPGDATQRNLRFQVQSGSGSIQLPVSAGVGIEVVSDEGLTARGAATKVSIESGASSGLFSVSLDVINAESLTPGDVFGGTLRLSVSSSSQVSLLHPSEIPFFFSVASECTIRATGSSVIAKEGKEAISWSSERDLFLACRSAGGSAQNLALSLSDNVPRGISVVIEDGKGRELLRLDRKNRTGSLSILEGFVHVRVEGQTSWRYSGKLGISISPRTNSTVMRLEGTGIESQDEGAFLFWDIKVKPPIPDWVLWAVGLVVLIVMLSLRPRFPSEAQLSFSDTSWSPVDKSRFLFFFGPSICNVFEGGFPDGVGSPLAKVIATHGGGAKVVFLIGGLDEEDNVIPRGRSQVLLDGSTYYIGEDRLAMTWELKSHGGFEDEDY